MADSLNSTNSLQAEQQFCLEGCGGYQQYHHMRRQFESSICPFCEHDNTLNKILFEHGNWRAWHNIFSNSRKCKTMLVIVHKKHIRSLADILIGDWADFQNILESIHKHFELPGGMLFIRFGDMRLNAGTVPHLHWNLWVPDGTGEVRIPVIKDPKDRVENQSRAAGFAKRYEAGEEP